MNMTKTVKCGDVIIGGGAPVSIQSMTNTDTRDVGSTVKQIKDLADVGCQIVRLAVPDMEAARAIEDIKKLSPLPVVADIHFDHRLTIEAIRAGADKIRINPGNLKGRDALKKVVEEADERKIPIRVGVNGGSLEKDILHTMGRTGKALAESAMRNVRLLEEMDFTDIVISVKTSDVAAGYEAYKIVAGMTDHPLHIGVTEAGSGEDGVIRSAVGLGALLLEGIGDTMRVSVTGDPLQEVYIAKKILAAAGLRKEKVKVISCPTCGRTKLDLEKAVTKVKEAFENSSLEGITVAVMGCEVNGPGEAEAADVGVAWGKGRGSLFVRGKIIKTVSEDDIVRELLEAAENIAYKDK